MPDGQQHVAARKGGVFGAAVMSGASSAFRARGRTPRRRVWPTWRVRVSLEHMTCGARPTESGITLLVTVSALLAGVDCGGASSGAGGAQTTSTTDATTIASSNTSSTQSADGTTAAVTTGSGAPCGDGTCSSNEDAVSCCADCGICQDNGTVTMHTGVAGGTPGGAVTPGGMVDTHASFNGDGFGEYVFPMMIRQEPVDGTGYFWAQQFFFDGTTDGGYTGMQTGGIANGMNVGKLFIVSIWNALSAVPGPGAECEPFGGEGVGQSCRLALPWREKVAYRFAIRFVTDHQWSLHVVDPTLPGERLVGTITVPDTWGKLSPSTAGFTEYFAGTSACETVPEATALMYAPTADGALPTSVATSVYGTCLAQATSSCAGALCN